MRHPFAWIFILIWGLVTGILMLPWLILARIGKAMNRMALKERK